MTVEKTIVPWPKLRSSRKLAENYRDFEDAREQSARSGGHARPEAAILDDPEPSDDRDPATALTLLEAEACGLLSRAQLRTLAECHGTPEHETQRIRILEIAQGEYNTRRSAWPACAPGPLLPGPRGLLIPVELRGKDRAIRVRRQLEETARRRDLFRHEREALRALKRNGVRDPESAVDAAALERARLKRLSKGAKRARSAQAMMAGARARQAAAPEGGC